MSDDIVYHDCWYGEGYLGAPGEVWVDVKVPPGAFRTGDQWRLKLKVTDFVELGVVFGPMVVSTETYNGGRRATSITCDPAEPGGEWRVLVSGNWEVVAVRIRPPTRFDRAEVL